MCGLTTCHERGVVKISKEWAAKVFSLMKETVVVFVFCFSC